MTIDPQSNPIAPFDCDDAAARRWKEMSVEQKSPWLELGKLASEQYAKAKVRLDKKNTQVMKTAASLGPKKRAAAEAKVAVKTRVVSKAKVKPLPAKVKATPAIAKGVPIVLKATPTAKATFSQGKAKLVATLTEVAAPPCPRGSEVKFAGWTKKKSPSLGAKKTAIKVCLSSLHSEYYRYVTVFSLSH